MADEPVLEPEPRLPDPEIPEETPAEKPLEPKKLPDIEGLAHIVAGTAPPPKVEEKGSLLPGQALWTLRAAQEFEELADTESEFYKVMRSRVDHLRANGYTGEDILYDACQYANTQSSVVKARSANTARERAADRAGSFESPTRGNRQPVGQEITAATRERFAQMGIKKPTPEAMLRYQNQVRREAERQEA